MKFGPVPLDQAVGKILAHHVTGLDGRLALRKGKQLDDSDVITLRDLGREEVYVAELEPGDVDENTAASRLASALTGRGLLASKAHVGRVILQAETLGLLRVEVDRLMRVNECEGITVATLATNTVVRPRATVATVKIIPFAVSEDDLRIAERVAGGDEPLLRLDPIRSRQVTLILTGSPHAKTRVMNSFEEPMRVRIETLGSVLRSIEFLPLSENGEGEKALRDAIRREAGAGAEMIILAGETAIMDRRDLAPRAVERLGGEVTCFGAPVDPGNLLMLAYIGDVPILGAPGCARSPKTNVVDWVLPRLLAGDRLTRTDIIALGHGGLLEDIMERPMPRPIHDGTGIKRLEVN